MGFGKDGNGQVLYDDNLTIALGALANLDVIGQVSTMSAALVEDYRIIKMDGWIFYETTQGGPLIVGIAPADMSDTEIEECLEANPVDGQDTPATEQVNRPVFPLAVIHNVSAAGPRAGQVVSIEKTLRWTFQRQEGWKYWAYNRSGGTLTTGGVIGVFMKYYGVWVR